MHNGLAVDAAGNLYIADDGHHRIRKVDPKGIITTVAGNGSQNYSGDGVAATKASLYRPSGVAVDAAGNLYIADTNNFRIRKVDTSGIITTIAGTGAIAYRGDGGPAINASFSEPTAVALDAAGNIYVADRGSANVVRKIDPLRESSPPWRGMERSASRAMVDRPSRPSSPTSAASPWIARGTFIWRITGTIACARWIRPAS